LPAPRNRRHLTVPNPPTTNPYRPHGKKIKTPQFPGPRDRLAHARTLREALQHAAAQASECRAATGIKVHGAEPGLYIQFESPPGIELKLESLENRQKGIELVAVQTLQPTPGDEVVQLATVFVPDGQLKHFVSRFEQYASEQTKRGKPRHKDLVDRIASLRRATLRALWTDEAEAYPKEGQAIWWEVWLRRQDGRELERLFEFAQAVKLAVGERRLAFDDRQVVLVRGTAEQLSGSLDVLNDLAEVRLAKKSAAFFVDAPAERQAEWVDDLVKRTRPPSRDAPAVCILDTGVTRAHPLLDKVIASEDASAVDPAWGPHDNGGGPENMGHGTEMAGLAAYGDLIDPFLSGRSVRLSHRLESVKILPPKGANDPELYGAITAQAVTRPEVTAPHRPRVFSLAVTALDERDRGQPTSWSAALDALAFGRIFDPARQELRYLDDPDDGARRLFIVSAGNVAPSKIGADYLDRCDLEAVHDPAQAWNAVTVGACTEKSVITDPDWIGWSAISRPGDLSPWSSTSVTFQDLWPIKPDVVFEGGNVALNGAEVDCPVPDLCVLSTYYKPTEKLLVLSYATSAATAQVARMAAIIRAEYPAFWPETVRALLVHAARWTPTMKKNIENAQGKRAKARLVRRYGFGACNLERAILSAKDALTLVAQATLRPFQDGRMREMHLHELPWPINVLRDLGEAEVRLRLTLSYFIEPNPGRRGWKRRHRYASYGLRFDVKSPTETLEGFRKRLNRLALEEDEQKPGGITETEGWLLGERARNKGSIHSDIWVGTAADLAERGAIGVYPVSGWWKDQPKRDRSDQGVPYSLVVTIETDAQDVDIWIPVAVQVQAPVQEVWIQW
jgi:hypothetical protein